MLALLEQSSVYAAIGALIGFFSGLLGIGGGAVQTPLTVLAFEAHGLPHQHIAHIAVATGVASIAFTAVSSTLAHHRYGAVDWQVLRGLLPGLIIGGFAGGYVALLLPTRWLAIVMVVFISYASLAMVVDLRPAPSRGLPGPAGLALLGGAVGLMSTLVGAGGAVLLVPVLTWFNLPFKRAIGTGASIGLPIAITGTTSHVLAGLNQPDLPPGSLGFVWLPALIPFVLASVVLAPYGARLAHRVPARRLRLLFAITTFVLALRMGWSLAGG
ncbi:MAG: sulfite exporter TauE/SafE family protein [Burkholderiaceae bacterium]